MAADRIYITGGLASGKSTLARRVGQQRSLEVHELDLVARVGGGLGPQRDASERDAMVQAILAGPTWIVEGIHVGWTDALLKASDAIVWLDHVAGGHTSRRIFRRFVTQATAEARRQRGWRRFFRFGDYARILRALGSALTESRGFDRDHAGPQPQDDTVTRADIERALEPYREKVMHCRTAAEVDAAVASLTPMSAESVAPMRTAAGD